MPSGGTRVEVDALRQIGFAGIGAGFAPVGAVFTNPIRILTITNNTNSALLFSYDGVTVHEYVPAQTGKVLDFTANSGSIAFPLISSGTTIYVDDDGVVPTSGKVAISAYYCTGD